MSDILYGKVRIYTNAGQTITITDGKGQTRSVVTTGQDYTDIILAGMEEYTLSNGSNSQSILLNNGGFLEVNLPMILEGTTWEQIQQIIQAGTFGHNFQVGDTKSFAMNNKIYHAEVVAINDGTGSAAQWYPDKTVDFICKELYETAYAYNSSGTNSGGFPNSALKDTLINTIYPLLPTDLKAVIIDKSHLYQSGSYSSNRWNSNMTTLATKLWLPTRYEVGGNTNTNAAGEDSTNNKKYYISRYLRRKKGGNGSDWWLSSPVTSYSSYFWSLDLNGSFKDNNISFYSYGVPLCFRIG